MGTVLIMGVSLPRSGECVPLSQELLGGLSLSFGNLIEASLSPHQCQVSLPLHLSLSLLSLLLSFSLRLLDPLPNSPSSSPFPYLSHLIQENCLLMEQLYSQLIIWCRGGVSRWDQSYKGQYESCPFSFDRRIASVTKYAQLQCFICPSINAHQQKAIPPLMIQRLYIGAYCDLRCEIPAGCSR